MEINFNPTPAVSPAQYISQGLNQGMTMGLGIQQIKQARQQEIRAQQEFEMKKIDQKLAQFKQVSEFGQNVPEEALEAWHEKFTIPALNEIYPNTGLTPSMLASGSGRGVLKALGQDIQKYQKKDGSMSLGDLQAKGAFYLTHVNEATAKKIQDVLSAIKPPVQYVATNFGPGGGVEGFTPLPEGTRPGPSGRPMADPNKRTQVSEDSLALRTENTRIGLVNNFNSETGIKKSQQSLESALMIRDLAESGNPIGAAAIPTFAARMAGEVGALTEPDKAPFGGTRAILGRLAQAIQEQADGKLTHENKKFLLDLTKVIERRARLNKTNLAHERAKQHAVGSTVFTEDQLYKMYDPQGNKEGTAPGAVEDDIDDLKKDGLVE